MSTSIDIKFSDMSNPKEVSVRILQAAGNREDGREVSQGRHHASPYRLGVGRPKKAGREYPKSPMKKTSSYKVMDVPPSSYDVFTITAYLPSHDSSDGERRLKVRRRERGGGEKEEEGAGKMLFTYTGSILSTRVVLSITVYNAPGCAMLS